MKRFLALWLTPLIFLAACSPQAANLPPTVTAVIRDTAIPAEQPAATAVAEPTSTPTAPSAAVPTAPPCSATWYPIGFSADGKTLFGLRNAEGAPETWLQALDLQDLSVQTVASADASAAVAALSPDRQTLAWAMPDFSIQLLRLADGKVTAALAEHQAQVNALLFSPDGAFLYSASSDGSVVVWDMKKLVKQSAFQPTFTADNIPGQVLGLGIAPDGKTLIAIPVDGSARAWDTTTFKQVGEYPGSISGSYNGSRALYSPDGKYLAIGLAAGPGDTALWRLADGAQIWSGGFMAGFDFSPDSKRFASIQMDENNRSQILIRSADGQTVLDTIQPSSEAMQMRPQFSPDGKTLVTTTGTQVDFWNSSSGALDKAYTPTCP